MKLGAKDQFTTIHNYIDLKNSILRKGAISAQEGERVIIPLNMRDGSILAVGKGNPDWNFSAPHGAGRLMSRQKAKATLTLKDFKSSMEGIFTTSVGKDTIDEAPAAYKPMGEILECIRETVTVEKIIKPVYNFKAGE
jgi:tRNA-splicing ligase RtcB (3'-phosphate/5'-hydroxy nucleic acid ligase)